MQVHSATPLSLLAVAVISLPGPARAEDTSLVATGDVATGYTDNILAVPDTRDPLAPQVESGYFMNVGPGLAATYETRQALHNLSYRFSARLYLEHGEANSYSNDLTYRGLYALTPLSSLRTGAGFSTGRINAFDRATPGDHVADLPTGDVTYVRAVVSVEHQKTLSRDWDLITGTNLSGFMPTNSDTQGNSWVWANNVRVQRRWRFHMLGAQVDASVSSVDFPTLRETQRSGIGGGRLVWTWDITDRLSSTTYGGVSTVLDLDNPGRRIGFPIAGVSLAYAFDPARFSIAFNRGVYMNAFTGDVTFTDSVSAMTGTRIPYTQRFFAAAVASYGKGRFIDLDIEDLAGDTEYVSGAATLSYAVSSSAQVVLSASMSRQTRDDPFLMDRFGIGRKMVLLSAVGQFPSHEGKQVPLSGRERVQEEEDPLVDERGSLDTVEE